MKIQAVKHSVSKVAGLMAIATTAALFSLPALAGVGEAIHRMSEKPQSSSKQVPTAPTSTTESPSSTPMNMEPTAPASGSTDTTVPSGTTEITPSGTTPSSTTPSSSTGETQSSPTAASGTIVEVAASNSSFKTLTAAVKAAGLTQELSGKGPFTVFAPTDAAFAALPEGTVEKLLKPENKAALRKLLTYHVVPGEVESTELKTGRVKTVEGAPVAVRVNGSSVMVNDAKVTTPDIKAENGVIHVIDKVILPPDI